MRVILLEKIRNVGERYELVDVAPGYAQNFLFPRGLAKPATSANLRELQEKKSRWEQSRTEQRSKIEKSLEKLKNLEIRVQEKANEEGRLFGSVDSQRIKKLIQEKGHDTEGVEVELKEPIKETGEYTVKLSFPYDLEVEVNLLVESE